MSFSKGSFLIEDILSTPKTTSANADRVLPFDARLGPPPVSEPKPVWFPPLDRGPSSRLAFEIASDVDSTRFSGCGNALSSRDPRSEGESAEASSSVGGVGSGETRVGDSSIAVPVPMPPDSGRYPAPYRYPSENLMPLNLAAKAPLSSDVDAPAAATPIVSIPKLPLNVPSYVPKFKGDCCCKSDAAVPRCSIATLFRCIRASL